METTKNIFRTARAIVAAAIISIPQPPPHRRFASTWRTRSSPVR